MKTEAIIPMVEREPLIISKKATLQLDADPWNDTLHPAHPKALYRGIGKGFAKHSSDRRIDVHLSGSVHCSKVLISLSAFLFLSQY